MRAQRSVPRRELAATLLWTGAGALLALSTLFGFSYGLLGLPLALFVVVWLAKRYRAGRAPLGLGLGLSVLPVWVAVMHSDYSPCPPSPADVADGNWSCGGTNPLPFAIVAAAMIVGFFAAWRFTRD